ncbi:MAG: hypothetical protein VZQ81_02460 [Succiniclasticum sp.]|nr:hypothetical protein [Succiniclasticum sp.]
MKTSAASYLTGVNAAIQAKGCISIGQTKNIVLSRLKDAICKKPAAFAKFFLDIAAGNPYNNLRD